MAPSLSQLLSLIRAKLRLSNLPRTWKLLALAFALLNLKSLPFAWHIRLIYGLYIQIRSSIYRTTHVPGPRTLFAPLITTSRNSPLECDYNFHKSNSTYFTDSDVGRLHLIVAICGKGWDRVKAELNAEVKVVHSATTTAATVAAGGAAVNAANSPSAGGTCVMALGGISATFRREIRPLQSYEIWTRLLAWDGKWLYLVQHFVRPGVVKKGPYLLQPWRRHQKGKPEPTGGDANGIVKDETRTTSTPPHPAIFATVIAKYVFKQGRKTIQPERVLRASGLLPPKPVIEGPAMQETNAVSGSQTSLNGSAAAAGMEDKAGSLSTGEALDWDWDRVERERVRGMKIADFYAKLDALSEEFPGDGAEVLGMY